MIWSYHTMSYQNTSLIINTTITDKGGTLLKILIKINYLKKLF